jgi:hypothetical protein
MQIPLLEGRFFNDGDTGDAPPVVIVDKYLVDRYFPGRSAIGQQVRRGGPTSPAFTIVGVVGTINAIDLGQPVLKERLYYPVLQQARPSMGLVLKTGLDPTSLVAQVRAAVQSIDPEQPIAGEDDGPVGGAIGETRRTPMTLLGIFGGGGARVVGDWHLRGAGVRGGAARPRVRDSPGARCRPPLDSSLVCARA